jgi:CBS domain-containing protein
MSPQEISDGLVRAVPLIPIEASVEQAVVEVLESGLPALPVADKDGRFSGLFGEREFLTAVFPAYVAELPYAAFVPPTLDEALQMRAACRTEPVSRHMNSERVDVPTHFSDFQVAEIFLHHRVLIVPVTEAGQVIGVITRSDFFRRLAKRFVEGSTRR